MKRNNKNKEENVKDYSDVLPPGFRFNPTNQELVKYYLTKKVAEEPLPKLNVIKERTLYGKEAEEPSQFFAGKSEEFLYFFTQVNKKFVNTNGNKMDRISGKGTWKMQNSFDVCDGQTLIGYHKTFSFKNSQGLMFEENDEVKISYIMNEYTLKNPPPLSSSSSSSQQQQNQAEWTICKIRKKVTTKKNDYNDQASLDKSSVSIRRKGKLQADSCKKRKRIDDAQTSLVNFSVSTRKGTKQARTSKALASLPPTITTSDVGFLQKDHDNNLPSSWAVMPHQPEQKPKPVHLCAESQLYIDYDNDSETVPLAYALAYTPAVGTSIIPEVNFNLLEYSQQRQSEYMSWQDRNVAAQADNQGVYTGPGEYSQPSQSEYTSPHDQDVDDIFSFERTWQVTFTRRR
ncbi:hypothetical protein AQUCO_05600046v1 [Aquilegia coerulea]|uniref:NAC domain-containing protein n=1 Tax=Aquilegia coerulea TaxID=218851 RepID=A0A2G5CGF3_AQUCA|nr:hypothetical protein AQUCO_05600046v1 [Aquilegia coerulea]